MESSLLVIVPANRFFHLGIGTIKMSIYEAHKTVPDLHRTLNRDRKFGHLEWTKQMAFYMDEKLEINNKKSKNHLNCKPGMGCKNKKKWEMTNERCLNKDQNK